MLVIIVITLIVLAGSAYRLYAGGSRGERLTKADLRKMHDVLEEKVAFYRALSVKGKSKFVKRLIAFENHHEFVGAKGVNLDVETVTLISAGAIKLTFGLRSYKLKFIRRIIVYPKPFYNRRMGVYLKGGTSQAGVVMLSFSDVEKGFLDPNDKINLALHEFAHAIVLELRKQQGSKHVQRNFRRWLDVAVPEFKRLKRSNTHFLRDYAKVNMHEFFAVCIEHFFEHPEGFKKAMPRLYKETCGLLRQNPLLLAT